MIHADARVRTFATCLSALAGYVDAIGFLSLGGFFVSFMSGNTTRLAVGAAHGAPSSLIAAGLIGTFVLGVVAGSLVGHAAAERRRPAVLALVTGLLVVAATCGQMGERDGATLAMALAMGAENAIFERDGEVRIGLTYMTGTLVKLGQRVAAALLGGDRLAWAPHLLLWLGLLVGAFAGACVYPGMGLSSLWIAAACAGGLTCVAALEGRRDRAG